MDFQRYSRPGAPNQAWHCDGGHVNPDAGWPDENGVEAQQLSKAYAICVFTPLIDLSETVGFTQFWPGSHKYEKLLGFGPAAEELGEFFNMTRTSLEMAAAAVYVCACLRRLYLIPYTDVHCADCAQHMSIIPYTYVHCTDCAQNMSIISYAKVRCMMGYV